MPLSHDACGSERGYRHHRLVGEVPCGRCTAATTEARARRGGRSRRIAADTLPDNPLQYRLALRGQEPADALTTDDRRRLIRALHNRGWADLPIAVHTRMTDYTTARIRSSLGLAPNRPRAEGKKAQ